MSNGEDSREQEQEISKLSSEKPKVRKWVLVNIKFIDGHFHATFNHDTPRIFHNMEELLNAIEAEAGKLTVSS